MKKLFLLISIVAAVVGCSKPGTRYHLEAEVISVQAPRGLITVKHGEIPGLMPAMTMQYEVEDPRQIEDMKPGDKITADLVVSESKGRLEKVTLVSRGAPKTGPRPN